MSEAIAEVADDPDVAFVEPNYVWAPTWCRTIFASAGEVTGLAWFEGTATVRVRAHPHR